MREELILSTTFCTSSGWYSFRALGREEERKRMREGRKRGGRKRRGRKGRRRRKRRKR